MYPNAVTLRVANNVFLLWVGVVDDLPRDVIISRDLPVLADLLSGVDSTAVLSYPVITRSQTKAGMEPLPVVVDSLFGGGQRGPYKS